MLYYAHVEKNCLNVSIAWSTRENAVGETKGVAFDLRSAINYIAHAKNISPRCQIPDENTARIAAQVSITRMVSRAVAFA